MLKKSIGFLHQHLVAVAAAAASLVVALPAMASATIDTSVQSAFTGTGQNVLDTVTSVLPDVLIPFAALLGISLIVRLYHKVRG